MPDIQETLHARFGFAEFRPGQREVIEGILGGQHGLVVMPTGAGKSLIYQLASLHLPGVTLVLSPLISLMRDQVEHLQRRQIPAAFINSTLPTAEQSARLQKLGQGDWKLVYVAPERLRSVPFRQALARTRIGLLAVDEAHCISQWGHDFRPDYLHIAAFRRELGEPLTVALTATATPEVQSDITRLLGIPTAQRVITGFNRPNLSFEVEYAPDLAAKYEALRELLGEMSKGAAIIYAGTRRDAEEVAEFVRSVVKKRAEYYHAGLENGRRSRVQDEFLSGKLNIVVATNAFGMGIDRPDVRLVVHFATPGTLEAYYQESGRAGRDGQPARALLLYSPEDRALQEWFIENDAPTPKETRTLYDALAAKRGAQFWIGYSEIALATHLPETKARVGLAQLEAAGSLARLGDENTRMLLKISKWNEAAAKEFADQVQERRRHRRAQLDVMIAYAESNHCRRRILLDYFGDHSSAEAARCCDNCLSQKAAPQPATLGDLAELTQAERIPLIILDALRRLGRDVGRDKLADLLCGSRSKDMQQFGYDQKSYYGRLSVFRQSEVEGMIDQLLKASYLKKAGGRFPVLHLTPKGEAALKARERISLQLPRSAPSEHKPDRRASVSSSRIQQVVRFGDSKSPDSIPFLIEALQDQDGNVRRLAASALGKIRSTKAVEPLLRLLEHEDKPQVRQYTVKALGLIGDLEAHAVLGKIAQSSSEQDYTRAAAKIALHRIEAKHGNTDEVSSFLSRSHPRRLLGPWQCGWSLGFHSRHDGATWSRSPVGELAYRLKYDQDASALEPLVEQALALCREHPELAQVDAIAPVPCTETRAFAPVRALAEALSAKLGKPLCTGLTKTRQTAPQKEMHTLAEKRANVAGAFAADREARGKRLLVVDDLYDSGATLEEIARTLKQAGAAAVCVLVLTSTIHSDA